MKNTTWENYPVRIAILSNAVAISLYALGALIVGGFGILVSALFLLYCLGIEVNVLRKSCVHCYYYGKVCGLGKGKLCARLFRRGDPRKFVEREVSWRTVLPDALVLMIPLIGGTALLIMDFSWSLAAMLAILVALSLGGNALVRGSFACKYCKQRELGCPAQQLFGG